MFDSINEASQKTDYRGQTFIGKVVDNNDPRRLERVKVLVPGLYEGDAGLLPWVAPKVGKGFGNQTGIGVFSVPDINSYVYVELQNGNPHYPFYIGSPVQSRADLPEADVNYPNRYGFKDKRGNLVYVDTTPGQNIITLQHASGTFVRINNDGSVDLDVKVRLTSTAPEWRHTGNVFVTGDLQVTGTASATVDVVGRGISLPDHVHGGVDTGGGFTAPPT